MGEHRGLPSLLRAAGAVGLAGGAALALTSCSLFGVAPTSAATPSSEPTEILDPSIPIETPTASSSPTGSAVPTATAVPTFAPKPTSKPATAPATKRSVAPFITLASWDSKSRTLDVGALVPGVVESGGICTLTATRLGVTRTASAPSAAVSSYTGCNPLSIDGAALSDGTWTIRVSYSSSRSAGTSSAKTVAVRK